MKLTKVESNADVLTWQRTVSTSMHSAVNPVGVDEPRHEVGHVALMLSTFVDPADGWALSPTNRVMAELTRMDRKDVNVIVAELRRTGFLAYDGTQETGRAKRHVLTFPDPYRWTAPAGGLDEVES